MATTTETTMMLEVEFDLSGAFQPGYPATGPSYASGGEPGEPDCIEDAEIKGLFIDRVKRDRFGLPVFQDIAFTRKVYERVDLLASLKPETRAEVLNALSDILSREIGEQLLEDYAEAA